MFLKIYLGEINRVGKLRSCEAILYDVKTCFFENITSIPSQKYLWDWPVEKSIGYILSPKYLN